MQKYKAIEFLLPKECITCKITGTFNILIFKYKFGDDNVACLEDIFRVFSGICQKFIFSLELQKYYSSKLLMSF